MGKLLTPHHILSLLLLLGCSSLILMGAVYGGKTSNSDNASAMQTSNVVTMSMTSLPRLELSMAANSVSLAIEPASGGQFGKTPLDIFVDTNSTSGYTLTMKAEDDNGTSGALKRTKPVRGEDYYIYALEDNHTCETETDTSCTGFPAGHWGYKVGDTANTYQTVTPALGTAQELKKQDSPTINAADRTTLYFGSSIDNSTPTGSYTGVKLTFIVTTNSFQWTIAYHAGNEAVDPEDVTGLRSGVQTGLIDEEETEQQITLDGAPSRKGYAFLGWCTVAPTTNEKGLDVCDGGTKYSAGQEVTIGINDPYNINLYAMWSGAKATVNFTFQTGVASLTLRGYFDGEEKDHTIYASTPLELVASSTYILTPDYTDGYRAPDDNKITLVGDGSLEQNIYTAGNGDISTTIVIGAAPRDDMTLKVYFNPAEVKSVSVREGSASGTVKATLTTGNDSTGPILTLGYNYYLVPEYQDNFSLAYWEKSGTAGTLSSTSDKTPYYNISYDNNAGNASNAVTLYTAIKMQNMDPSKCPTAPRLAYDTRDEHVYTIGKMKDGSCWMLSNLNLGGSTAMTLRSSDTNISSSSWTLPALSTSVPANDYDNARLYRYSTTIKMYVSGSWVDAADNEKGILYNYVAASAGTIKGSSNDSTQKYDICPKGWRLPSANSADSDTGKLAIAYNGNSDGISKFSTETAYTDFNNAFRTVLSGSFDSDKVFSVNTLGSFWSSVAINTTSRYSFDIDASSVAPAAPHYRRSGRSIRCVLNQ